MSQASRQYAESNLEDSAPASRNRSVQCDKPCITTGSASSTNSGATTPMRIFRGEPTAPATAGGNCKPNNAPPSNGPSLKSRNSQPSVSNACDKCTPPRQSPRPCASSIDARYPASPHNAAGTRTDPPVSVPIPATAEPSCTLAAAPLEEPPVSSVASRGCVSSP